GDGIADEGEIVAALGRAFVDDELAGFPTVFLVAAGVGDGGGVDVVVIADVAVAFLHGSENFGVGGVVVDAAEFVWIFFEIEELPVHAPGEKHDFVAIGPDTVVDGNLVPSVVFVVGIIDGVAPVGGGFGSVFE